MCIYAKKGKLKSRFTKFIWANMGKNKEGWEEVTKKEYEAETPEKENAPPPDVQKVQGYKALVERAKGFEADDAHEAALKLYREALVIKHTKGVADKIKALEKLQADATAEENAAAELSELLSNAEAAFNEQDYATALELYSEALSIKKDKAVAAKVKECEEALAG